MFTTHTPGDPRPTPATSQLDRRQSSHLKENHLNPFFGVAAKRAMNLQRAASPKLPSFPMQSLVPKTTTFSSADAINNPDLGWL